MTYTIKQIHNRETWDTFVKKQPYTLFVQSSSYGDFFSAMNETSWVFGIYDTRGTLVGGSLVLSTHAKRGNFLYLPYGPLIALEDIHEVEKAFHVLTRHIRTFAKQKKYSFIRVSPFIDETLKHTQIFARAGYRKSPMHILAETTWLLNITQDEETLLSNMKKNHRNLIRRCIREGVTIEKRTDPEALDILHTLLNETKKRHRFTPFSKDYINNEFASFVKNDQAAIFVATLPSGEIDSCAIIMFYGNMAVYRHSGSLNLNKKIPSSYLIQWEVIREAKRRGMTWYNFWGIAPDDAPDHHPFKGITHFKTGFGGEKKDLLHCQDFVVSWGYWFNWIIEQTRSIRRGFKY